MCKARELLRWLRFNSTQQRCKHDASEEFIRVFLCVFCTEHEELHKESKHCLVLYISTLGVGVNLNISGVGHVIVYDMPHNINTIWNF